MSRYAVIDVGTNSDLLLIAEPTPSGWSVILDVSTITRLGEGLTKTGRIGEVALQRNIDCLRAYRERCDENQVKQVAAVGTSALRDAANSQEVLARIGSEADVDIEIISGETEAALSFLAVRRDDDLDFPSEGWVAVVDIGGGSAELIIGRDKLESARSVNVGAVRMTETYLKSDPPTEDEFTSMMRRIREEVPKLTEGVEAFSGDASPPQAFTLAGVGGTIVNLANIQRGGGDFRKVHGDLLTIEDIVMQVMTFSVLNLNERRAIRGLEPERADVILAGAEILLQTMRHLRQPSVRVSTRGLRYGVLYDRFGARR